MPRFRYQAVDREGRTVAGEMAAADAEQLAARLNKAGLSLESAVEILSQESEEGVREIHRLTVRDFRQLAEHLGDLTDSGLPLVQGLQALSEELPNRRLRHGLRSIVAQLETGAELTNVLQSHGAPADLRALITAGIRSGHTGELLGRYAAGLRRVADVRRRIFLTLSYPLLVVPLVAVVGLYILVGIVPELKNIFEDFGVQLPAVTEVLIVLSDALIQYGTWFAVGAVSLAALLWVIVGVVLDAATRRQLVCSIPVVGSLLRLTALSRFAHLLAMLVENNVPLPQALTLAADGAGDAEIQSACWHLAADVETGAQLEESARQIHGLPATLVQTLTWHKQGPSFPDALRALADLFEAQAFSRTDLVGVIWQPALLIGAGAAMGFLIVALFLPAIRLISDLS